MGWPSRLWRTLFSRGGTRPPDADLEEELRLHLDLEAEHNLAAGMTPEDAVRRAHVRLGNRPLIREHVHAVWRWVWLDDLQSDLRFGVRGLARNPGFTATAALTLSIGIGGTAAMFSVTNAYLLRPFPAPEGERLVVVAQLDEPDSLYPDPLSYPEYLDYRDHNQVFEGLAAYRADAAVLSADGASGRAATEYVSRDFFEVLRVDAALGRTFLPDEGRQPGDAAVVVLSHRAWQRRFGADLSVVGRVVRLGTTAHTVIGVTPASFAFSLDGFPTELFVPVTQIGRVHADRENTLTDRGLDEFHLIGRLKPGVTVADAREPQRAEDRAGGRVSRLDEARRAVGPG